MFKIIKVTGESLSPFFHGGDYALIIKPPFVKSLQAGDVVVFKQAEYGLLIKKVARLDIGGNIHVIGDHDHSVDSRRFGPIHPQDILGKVIFHIRKN